MTWIFYFKCWYLLFIDIALPEKRIAENMNLLIGKALDLKDSIPDKIRYKKLCDLYSGVYVEF